jgi:hypothetical protein
MHSEDNNKWEIKCLDSFVIGLSPTFWAYVPLMIAHITRQLHLVDGTQCFIINVPESSTNHQVFDSYDIFSSMSSSISAPQKAIPISKCHIVGSIVSADRKANGCIMFVLDDGTGLIDVVHYSDGDSYSLPSLSKPIDYDGGTSISLIEPGNMVRIFGRIHCKVAPGAPKPKTDPSRTSRLCQIVSANSITYEIYASLILPLGTIPTSRTCSRNCPNSVDQEADHWLNCLRFFHGDVTGVNQNGRNAELPCLNNAFDVLPLLGSCHFNQVVERSSALLSLASTAENYFESHSWRLFGTQCQCRNVALKRDLLYCRCIATRLDNPTMDTTFRYRDGILMKLLKAEAAFASALRPPKSTDEIWNDIINNVEVDQCHLHFRFQYNSVASDNELNQIAREEICKSTSSGDDIGMCNKLNQDSSRSVQELVRGTVRALRKDGILYLEDSKTDTYILISRIGVLEPYIRTKLALQKLSPEARARYYEAKPRFEYIKSVPRSRLEFLRRGLTAAAEIDLV